MQSRTITSDELRQKLLYTSVKHHEAVYEMQRKERDLLDALHECSRALDRSLRILLQKTPHRVPADLLEIAHKYAVRERTDDNL